MLRDYKYLLAAINALWILQSSLPLLDRRLPSLFSFPLSQLLSLGAGALLVIRLHSLLVRLRRSGQLSFYTNTLFLALSSLWSMGLGMHTSAVIIQNELTQEDPLYPLVHDRLHRFWSHHMFGCGYFGLLFLLLWTEANHSPSQDETEDEPSVVRDSSESSSSYTEMIAPPTSNLLQFIKIFWSIIVGVIYSIVAEATHTVALTTAFYIATVSLCYVNRKKSLWTMPSITSSITLSSFSGLFVLVLYKLILCLR